MKNETTTMNIEQFRKLKIVEKGEGRKKIVDWTAVLKHVAGKVLTKKDFETIVIGLYKEKKAVNYSEMYRVFETWMKAGHKIESRIDEEKHVLYLIE